jgi:hypothetical protein
MSTEAWKIGTPAAPARARVASPVPGPVALEWRPFLLIVCGFWLYATVSAVLYAYGMEMGLVMDTGKSVFAGWQPRVVLYLLLLPLLVGCYRLSLAIGWQPLARRLPLQLGLGAAFAVVPRPLFWLVLYLFEGPDVTKRHPGGTAFAWVVEELPMWLASFTEFLVRYGFGLALVTGFAVYKRLRDAELRAGALEQQWSDARLAALRMQLSPHTLFNLLHTIRGQIAWDPSAAQGMVVQLADLLRRLLNAGERDFESLADELGFVRLYLELQCRRFSDRLTLALPDPATLPAAWVPSLILQPLVENAVVHGLAGHDGPVRVTIEVEAADGRLRCAVRNAVAPGRAAGAAGVGLRNVAERLAVQFGADARFESAPDGAGAWVARIEMPLLAVPPRPGRG